MFREVRGIDEQVCYRRMEQWAETPPEVRETRRVRYLTALGVPCTSPSSDHRSYGSKEWYASDTTQRYYIVRTCYSALALYMCSKVK